MKNLATLLICFSLLATTSVSAKQAGGETFSFITKSGDKKLKLVGAGVRKKWFFSVYSMGLYTESGKCDFNEVLESKKAQSNIIVMLRNISAAKMKGAIDDSLKLLLPKNPSAKLLKDKQTFLNFFKTDLKEGVKVKFDYLPGKGLTVTQDGKNLGSINNDQFAQLYFKMYFGPETCCPTLKKQIKTCHN